MHTYGGPGPGVDPDDLAREQLLEREPESRLPGIDAELAAIGMDLEAAIEMDEPMVHVEEHPRHPYDF